jgi:hypothetical protein
MGAYRLSYGKDHKVDLSVTSLLRGVLTLDPFLVDSLLRSFHHPLIAVDDGVEEVFLLIQVLHPVFPVSKCLSTLWASYKMTQVQSAVFRILSVVSCTENRRRIE